MPIPKPQGGESRDDFISRCLGNETMVEEYPEQDQRNAVCASSWRETKRDNARFAQTHTWDAEVFAVGKWNGFMFSAADLKAIADSFNALHSEGVLEAPLKFGHNDDQPMTDGAPALGWVEKLYVQEDEKGRDKLYATLVDVPAPVYEAAKKKLYRKVSIELDIDVEHKGKRYPFVLTGVALLGADLPAVNTLADLNAYMSRSPLGATRRATFSAVSDDDETNPPEGNTMEISKEEFEKLQRDAAKAAEAEKARQEAQAVKDELQEFKRKEEKRKEDEEREKVRTAREAVTAKFNKAVEEMKITPAARDRFAKLFRVDDDEAVKAIDLKDVDALIEETAGDGKSKFGRETSGGSKTATDSQPGKNQDEDNGDFLTREAYSIQSKDPKMSFSRALELAMRAHPEEASKHVFVHYSDEQ